LACEVRVLDSAGGLPTLLELISVSLASDLEELLHLLRDVAPAVAGEIRCSKVRAMHASRACRRSVMVGTALSARQMSKILLHFSTLDQPWVRRRP
jgi:DNA mismatch repair ATPase MutL